MKTLRYFLEATLLYILFAFFSALSPEKASNIGGWIGRTIGPKLATNRKARRNLTFAMPDIDENKQNEIIIGMWDNLGRVIAEYPHLERISRDHTVIENKGRLASLLESQQPIVFFGGHLANWEVNSTALLTQYDKKIALTYRAPNNPWTAKLLDKARTLNGRLVAFPKSRESGKDILQTLRKGGALGILIDQKYNEGIDVPFFSLPAMTNPIFVQLCQKYKCPLVPVKNQRLSGCSFKLTPYPPLALFDKDDQPRPVEDVIKEAHTLLETWISDKPEQWIWLHRRWKDTTAT
tara:strand:+ start:8566 stop:9444 length:879 start_codon:yes stop_codon:yes gene_type:complete